MADVQKAYADEIGDLADPSQSPATCSTADVDHTCDEAKMSGRIESSAEHQHPEQDHRFSWQDIHKHDRPDDCWVVYEGKVYDVTSFVPDHPGGRALWWQGGGRDITILFNISHPPRVTEKAHIQKYGKYLGVAEGPETEGAPEYDWTSPYWCELKEKCWAKLNEMVRHYPGYEEGHFAKVTYGELDVTLYHGLLMFMWLVSLWYIIWSPLCFRTVPGFFDSPYEWSRLAVAAFIVSPLSAMISLTMHEARHRDSGIFWCSGADLCGVSSIRYMMEHVWHHNWPNLPDPDIEMDLFAYAPGLRNFPWQEHRWYHRFQLLYWPISFALVIPKFVISDISDWLIRGRRGKMHRGYWTWGEYLLFIFGHLHILTTILPVVIMESRIGYYSINHYWGQLLIILTLIVGGSFFICVINMPAHLPEVELSEAKMQYEDFARTQVAHCTTYGADNTVLTWLFQGMNTQTEHHLFPTVSFKYLQSLTPVIAEVSKRHGVDFGDPYHSYRQAFNSWLRRIYRLSSPNETCKEGSNLKYITFPDSDHSDV